MEDILDIQSLLNVCKSKDTDKMKEVCEFLNRELRCEIDQEKVESNIAAIISILSKEDRTQVAPSYETEPYNIDEKITYNELNAARILIDDYRIYHSRIIKIYSEFDRQGANKSFSILNGIRAEYAALW